ncbi:MAG: hypothetical protein RJA56_1125 [Pseudomonadota bacterium]
MFLASPWASAANKSQLVNTCVLPGLTKVVFMQNMIANGYEDKRTLQRRIPTAAEYFGAMGIVNKDGAATLLGIFDFMAQIATHRCAAQGACSTAARQDRAAHGADASTNGGGFFLF